MGRDSKDRGRGSRTHGHGSQKKNRGAGNRGGRGDAGRKKHEARNHEPLGKHGFKRPQAVQEDVATVNVGDLDLRVHELVEEGVAEETDDGYRVDAEQLDVDKVLGGGQVRNSLEVHAPAFSDGAAEKIADAGGEAVATADDGDEDDEAAEGEDADAEA